MAMKARLIGRGVVPLLMHRRLKSDLGPNAEKGKVTNRDWEEIDGVTKWKHYAHFSPEIGVYIPSEALEKCLYFGGTKVVIKGNKTMRGEVESYFLVSPTEIPLLCKGKPILNLDDMEAFEYPAVNPTTKAGIWRIRPIFRDWSFECDLYIAEDYPKKMVETVVEKAGMAVGLLNWRPRFGRFDPELKWL